MQRLMGIWTGTGALFDYITKRCKKKQVKRLTFQGNVKIQEKLSMDTWKLLKFLINNPITNNNDWEIHLFKGKPPER